MPGLGEHRPEDDNIARSHVPGNRAVGAATIDNPLHGAVDLVPHRDGLRDRNGPPAMQRKDEFVPLGDRGLDEALQRVGGRRAVTFSSLHVREHLLERAVGKGVKQIPTGREVTVERPDADARVGRDGCHRHVRALPVHGCYRGADEGFVVAGRVAALFARMEMPRACHAPIEAVSVGDSYT